MKLAAFIATTALTATTAFAAGHEDRTGWPESFTVGTASQGGTYFAYGSGWANLVAEELGLSGGGEVTGGPMQNMALVHTGDAAFGMTTMGPAAESLAGTNPIAPGLQMDMACAMFPMYQTPFSVAALSSSGITSIADIPDGARIGFGPAAENAMDSKDRRGPEAGGAAPAPGSGPEQPHAEGQARRLVRRVAGKVRSHCELNARLQCRADQPRQQLAPRLVVDIEAAGPHHPQRLAVALPAVGAGEGRLPPPPAGGESAPAVARESAGPRRGVQDRSTGVVAARPERAAVEPAGRLRRVCRSAR